MPGLTGYISDKPADGGLLDRMVSLFVHEPFHRVDRFVGHHAAIARVHLGVLQPAAQPVREGDVGAFLFFDGKMFPPDGEKPWPGGSDLERFFSGYREGGKEFLKGVNGSFNAMIYEPGPGRLTIINDRFGFRPLSYFLKGGKLVFGPEIRPLLVHPEIEPDLDDRAVADWFGYGKLLGNRTFVRGIEVLPAASILTYENGTVRIEQYWELGYHTDHEKPIGTFAQELAGIFRRAVSRRLEEGKTYGISLSGGVDSRCITAAIPKERMGSVRAITFGLPDSDEAFLAARVARAAGIPHRVIEITPGMLLENAVLSTRLCNGEDPFWMSFVIAVGKIAREQGIDVILSGLVLDTFVVAPWFTTKLLAIPDRKGVEAHFGSAFRELPDADMERLFREEYYRKIRGMASEDFTEVFAPIPDDSPGNMTNLFIHRQHNRRFANLGLVIEQDAVDIVVPAVDPELVALAVTIPQEMRIHYHLHRRFLIALSPALARLPITASMLPASLPIFVWRAGKLWEHLKEVWTWKLCSWSGGRMCPPSSRWYTDPERWLRTDPVWQAWFRDLLLSDGAFCHQYIRKEVIGELLDDHIHVRADNSRKLVYIASFELMLREILHGVP